MNMVFKLSGNLLDKIHPAGLFLVPRDPFNFSNGTLATDFEIF